MKLVCARSSLFRHVLLAGAALLFGLAMAQRSDAAVSTGIDCVSAVANLEARWQSDPTEVFVFFRSSLEQHPDCHVELVAAMLELAEPTGDVLFKLLLVARDVLPEQVPSITEIALALSPDGSEVIQKAMAMEAEAVKQFLAEVTVSSTGEVPSNNALAATDETLNNAAMGMPLAVKPLPVSNEANGISTSARTIEPVTIAPPMAPIEGGKSESNRAEVALHEGAAVAPLIELAASSAPMPQSDETLGNGATPLASSIDEAGDMPVTPETTVPVEAISAVGVESASVTVSGPEASAVKVIPDWVKASSQVDDDIREAMARMNAVLEGKNWQEQALPDGDVAFKRPDRIRVSKGSEDLDEDNMINSLPYDEFDEEEAARVVARVILSDAVRESSDASDVLALLIPSTREKQQTEEVVKAEVPFGYVPHPSTLLAAKIYAISPPAGPATPRELSKSVPVSRRHVAVIRPRPASPSRPD